MDFANNITMTGQDFFDRILSAEGLAWIGVKILNQFDGETLQNCESVGDLWKQFIIENGLWKRQYFHKLANPGSKAYHLIKSNPVLFQFDQADQGNFSSRESSELFDFVYTLHMRRS
jgi:hypothetical protein